MPAGTIWFWVGLGSVIIVLFGVSSKRPWRSLLAVVLASLWAGISRINWLPVPAILAILLYVLDVHSAPCHALLVVADPLGRCRNPGCLLRAGDLRG